VVAGHRSRARFSARSSIALAVESVAEACLDGKPQLLRKRRTTIQKRLGGAWRSGILVKCMVRRIR
jgi:hypothetical protein